MSTRFTIARSIDGTVTFYEEMVESQWHVEYEQGNALCDVRLPDEVWAGIVKHILSHREYFEGRISKQAEVQREE